MGEGASINYFYGNTLLDGSSFSFVANPIAILKGRIIAFAVFGAYTLFQTVEPVVSLFIMLAVFPFIPLLVVRSMRFRMQNTEYRGLKFNFTGSVGHAYSFSSAGSFLPTSAWEFFSLVGLPKETILAGELEIREQAFREFPPCRSLLQMCRNLYPHGDRDDLSRDLDIGGRHDSWLGDFGFVAGIFFSTFPWEFYGPIGMSVRPIT